MKQDEWEAMLSRVIKICDEMIQEVSYKEASTIIELKKRILELKNLKRKV